MQEPNKAKTLCLRQFLKQALHFLNFYLKTKQGITAANKSLFYRESLFIEPVII